MLLICHQAFLTISIHAPTRGATAQFANAKSVLAFQSTLPRGERLNLWYDGNRTKDFNPRSHEGSDIGNTDIKSIGDDFNPRSHEGSDVELVKRYEHVAISIHAPTRGATKFF